ncbi:hypothetical protein SB773_32280, partial [Bacillus sp. SIMBA_074]|uniref:hypothetical protein n=1 Tax=Bacillus sp. SIMBA_074 TaxID=3085812 RepID=UPI00397B4409
DDTPIRRSQTGEGFFYEDPLDALLVRERVYTSRLLVRKLCRVNEQPFFTLLFIDADVDEDTS